MHGKKSLLARQKSTAASTATFFFPVHRVKIRGRQTNDIYLCPRIPIYACLKRSIFYAGDAREAAVAVGAAEEQFEIGFPDQLRAAEEDRRHSALRRPEHSQLESPHDAKRVRNTFLIPIKL